MSFAALEIKAGEREAETIHALFQRAAGVGLVFHFLEPYGRLTIGSTTFLRFKTDCPMDPLVPFFQEECRSLILPGKAGYRMVTQTTEGPIPITCVQAVRTPGYTRRWRGTSNKFWQRQFSS